VSKRDKNDSKKTSKGHSVKQQAQYEREARLQYGPTVVNESVQRWNSYSKAQQDAIQAEGGAVYTDLAQAMRAGEPVDSPVVSAILTRWYNHIRYFYEPTLEIARGLGELYNTDPAFMAFFHQFDQDLPAYLQATITHYVDEQETAALGQMLAEDEERIKRLQG
jgi:hypothetical protein